MELNEVWRRLETLASNHVDGIIAPTDAESFGYHVEELANIFECFGLCRFLMDGQLEQCRMEMSKAGYVVDFLHRSTSYKPSRFFGISRNPGLFAALISGNAQLARTLAKRLSDISWNESWEYEEDYLYRQFLNLVVLDPGDSDRHREVAERTSSELERLDAGIEKAVVESIVSRSEDAMIESLDALLQQEDDQIESARQSRPEDDCLFWPRAFVSVHCIAIVRIMERLGISLRIQHPRCPLQLLEPMKAIQFSDPFLELERLVGTPEDGPNK